MEDMNESLREIRASLGEMGKQYPEFMNSFREFSKESSGKEGALSVKTKELIGVALAVVRQCHWCIAIHVKDALNAGATKNEIMEACFVAVLMGGGPSLMYAQLAMKAVDDFAKK